MSRRGAILILCLVGLGCGREKSSNGSAAADAPKRLNSFAVVDAESLPDCNEAQLGALAYASKEEKFFSCGEDKTWTQIEIKANKGLEIDSIWQYHLDSLEDAKELAAESGSFVTIRLSTVRLTRYQNGSGFISVLGTSITSVRTEQGDLVDASDDFSHPFVLAATQDEQVFTVKSGPYPNIRARYKITLAETPAFKAVVDIDGNFTDNTDIDIPLEKQ
jgi:hypothetical protein